MSDFDFDELDKAVNSVIGQPSEENSPANEIEKTPVRNTTPSFALHSRTMASNRINREEAAQETSAPKENISQEVVLEKDATVDTVDYASSEASQEATPVERQAYLPKRRSGRFMDVVHPSSDMRSSSKPLTSRREGVRVQPTSQSLAAPVMDPSFTSITEAVESPSSHVEMNDSFEETAPETESPIPTENNLGDNVPVNPSLEAAINDLLVSEGHAPVVASDAPLPTETINETSAPLVAATPETLAPQADVEDSNLTQTHEENLDELSMDEILTDSQPQTSPFIEGAKVEKRPLGGLAPINVRDEPVETSEAEDPSLGRSDVGRDEPLPEELNQDLMSIEALETPTDLEEDVASVAETSAPEETPTPVKVEPAKVINDIQPEKAPVKTSESDSYSGPTSIAQQYKLEPREEKDDETGDIFDTKTYHQPIKDEEAKSSPLPWIIGLVIITVLIVAGLVFAWWSGMLVVPM